MERCGKRNASNSGTESWTGIGVVAGCGAVVLIMQWPHGKHRDVNWGSKLLQILQEVRSNCKTRNQLSMWWRIVSRTPDTVWQLLGQLSDFIGIKNRHCELW